ncbi:MAG: hypothetical protein AAGE86_03825 [Pseudomonadota bacterium]
MNVVAETAPTSGRACLIAAGSSVITALLVLFLWKTEAVNIRIASLLAIIPTALMIFAFVKTIRQTKTKASLRYLARMAIVMAFYLLSLFLAENLIEDQGMTGPFAVIIALLPGLSFAGVIWIFGGLIVEEDDEFFRMLYVRQGLIATAISFTLAAVWGFLETYKFAPPIEAYWWPTMWCFGLGIGAIFNKIKYGTYGEIR